MYALIVNNTVFQLFPEKPDLHPAALVVDVTAVAGVAVGWQMGANGTVTPPPALPPVVIPPEKLVEYAGLARDSKANAGIAINIAASGETPIVLDVDTTATGRTNILGLESLAAKGKPVIWIEHNAAITLTQAQLDLVAVTTGQYITDLYTVWGTIVAQIMAPTPSITTIDQINNAGWPSVTY